jgi:hypothetical protein
MGIRKNGWLREEGKSPFFPQRRRDLHSVLIAIFPGLAPLAVVFPFRFLAIGTVLIGRGVVGNGGVPLNYYRSVINDRGCCAPDHHRRWGRCPFNHYGWILGCPFDYDRWMVDRYGRCHDGARRRNIDSKAKIDASGINFGRQETDCRA